MKIEVSSSLPTRVPDWIIEKFQGESEYIRGIHLESYQEDKEKEQIRGTVTARINSKEYYLNFMATYEFISDCIPQIIKILERQLLKRVETEENKEKK